MDETKHSKYELGEMYCVYRVKEQFHSVDTVQAPGY